MSFFHVRACNWLSAFIRFSVFHICCINRVLYSKTYVVRGTTAVVHPSLVVPFSSVIHRSVLSGRLNVCWHVSFVPILRRPRAQNSDEGSNTYSTPNSEWAVLGSFQKGQVLEMDLIMNTNHMVSKIVAGVFQAYARASFCCEDDDVPWTL